MPFPELSDEELSHDSLRPIRGIVWGIALASILWGAIFWSLLS